MVILICLGGTFCNFTSHVSNNTVNSTFDTQQGYGLIIANRSLFPSFISRDHTMSLPFLGNRVILQTCRE